jgi:hypothetical protein
VWLIHPSFAVPRQAVNAPSLIEFDPSPEAPVMVSQFHEIRFPIDVSLGRRGGPRRRTDIVTLASGREERNARWAHSLRRYDAGLGVRTLDALHAVIAFSRSGAGASTASASATGPIAARARPLKGSRRRTSASAPATAPWRRSSS